MVLAHLINGDDMVVLQSGRGPRLAQEALPGGGAGGQGRMHHLQGHAALQLRIFGVEHDAHAAVTEHAQDAIRPQPADLIRLLRRGQKSVRFPHRVASRPARDRVPGFRRAAGGGRRHRVHG